MKIETKDKIRNKFILKIEELSGESLMNCYQCGKCSAGCPSVTLMDILPNQITRLAQLGREKEILESKTPWICASCYTCFVRCPKGVDLSKIMEAIRQISLRQNVDYVDVTKVLKTEVEELPQIAVVSNFRKFTG